MEQKNEIAKSDWALIEKIACEVYPNEASILTRDDINEIEEALDSGMSFDIDEDEGGDMDLSMSLTIAAFSLGLATIQAVLAYLSWKYPHENHIHPTSGITNHTVAKDFVSQLLADEEFCSNYRDEIRVELLKRKQVINSILEQIYQEK